MNSKLGRIDLADLLKGIMVSVGTAILSGILSLLQSGGTFTMENLKVIGIAALSAGIAYLLKQLATNSQGDIGVKEPQI